HAPRQNSVSNQPFRMAFGHRGGGGLSVSGGASRSAVRFRLGSAPVGAQGIEAGSGEGVDGAVLVLYSHVREPSAGRQSLLGEVLVEIGQSAAEAGHEGRDVIQPPLI